MPDREATFCTIWTVFLREMCMLRRSSAKEVVLEKGDVVSKLFRIARVREQISEVVVPPAPISSLVDRCYVLSPCFQFTVAGNFENDHLV